MTGITLYQAVLDKQNAIMLCVDDDGVIDVEKLDLIEGTLHDKVVACIAVNKTLDNQALGLIAQRDKVLAEYQREIVRLQVNADKLHANILAAMKSTGISKIQSDDGLLRARIQNNPPAVDIYEPGLIPSEYMTAPVAPPPAPNKAAIKAALQAGKEVQGARLSQGQRLVVS
jgi:hypothetical protein